MKKQKILLTSLLTLGFLAMGCASDDKEKKETTGAGAPLCNPTEVIEGFISVNRTIGANSCVAIKGAVTVLQGATLRIEEGAKVLADTSTLSYIKVNRGAKIEAVGTASNPVIFTSGAAVGSRSPSDWGGIVIHGASATNQTAGSNYAADTEIFTGPYGCGDSNFTCQGTPALSNNDNSGELRYVRVEFAGREIASGKEFNGIFLAGVGKGTKIEYVQVHRGSDDGIEIFGGAVDIRYAIITNNQDDQFDVDEGWRGIAQYVVAAVPKDGDQAIEYDGIGADRSRASNTIMSNFTMLGSLNKTIPGAISIRASGTARIYNSYIAHFWGANGIIAVANESVCLAKDGNMVHPGPTPAETDDHCNGDPVTPNPGFVGSGSGADAFVLRFESNFIECAFTDAMFSNPRSDLNALFARGNQPQGALPSKFNDNRTASASHPVSDVGRFPDSSGNGDNVYTGSCNSPKLSRPGENILWGVTNGVAEFIPAANITVSNFADPQAAPNGTDLPQPTYIGAFAAGDTWANGWTAFPVN
ncbi:MAG: hypothetical protein NZM25_03965 [Leptospiraceae bacterium]|nr:hypothetical protein [Leptospiraceae bacterium]MDW8306142.1 hypothetical protein [Leptospiraceae bacterium]